MSNRENLLFAALVLEARLCEPAQFAEACADWMNTNGPPLADLLLERGLLTVAAKESIEHRLQEKFPMDPGSSRSAAGTIDFNEHRSLSFLCESQAGESTGSFCADLHENSIADGASVSGHDQRYRRSRLHAQGGLGQVWLARDDSLGREVALKELKPELAHRPQVGARFLKEAKITSQLEHPGIVPVYELGSRSDTGQPFYTMRFVKGRTLTEAARAHHQQRAQGKADTLERNRLLNAFVSVCNTVAYAHARGVIHRDLKGQNVVVGDYGEVIVLDWGLAKIVTSDDSDGDAVQLAPDSLDDRTVQGHIVGTPAYMAPEQAAADASRVGPATDIYGLGAILYEILTGKPPFLGKDTLDVLRKVREEEPVRPRVIVSDVAPPLEAISLKALRKQPNERYPSATDLAQDVQRWLADEPVDAYREPWRARLGRWGRRHRPLVAAGMALMFTALIALVIGIILIGQEQGRTEEKRLLAVKNEKLANQQRDLAKASLALGLQAVNDSFTQLSENALLNTPGMQAHRKKLQESALVYFKDFLSKWKDDPAVESEVGLARFRIGWILTDMGLDQQAAEHLEQAYAIHKKLASSYPESALGIEFLAHASGALAVNKRRLHDYAAAVKLHQEETYCLQKLLALQNQAGASANVLMNRQAQIAAAQTNLSRVYLEANDLPNAKRALSSAVENTDKIGTIDPKMTHLRFGRARLYFDAALLCRAARQTPEAIQLHRQAVAILEGLPEANRRQPLTQQHLGNNYNFLGLLCLDAGGASECRAYLDKAIAIRSKLVVENPDVLNYRGELFSSLSNMAVALLNEKKNAEAIPFLQQAAQTLAESHASGKLEPANRALLARIYLLLAKELRGQGKTAEAIAALLRYREAHPLDAAQLFELGCEFARCAASVDAHTGTAPEKGGNVRDRYEELALEAIREAVKKGFRDVALLRSEASLAGLRKHTAFAQISHQVQEMTKE